MFDGKLVSSEWATVLTACRADGVTFRLNSGRRTMAEQTRLRAAYLRRLAGGPWAPLAAVPNPNAPHIRDGRPDHAIDVNATDGGARRVYDWLRRHNGHPRFTVPGEPWHLELPRTELVALAKRLANPLRNLTAEERHLCRAYDDLRRRHLNLARRRRLRAAMTRQRKRIWRAAQTDGWHRHHRRERYAALLKRTR